MSLKTSTTVPVKRPAKTSLVKMTIRWLAGAVLLLTALSCDSILDAPLTTANLSSRAISIGAAPSTWYLLEGGGTPSGLTLSLSKGSTTGFQPTRAITTTPIVWYSAALTGSWGAGSSSLSLWTSSPGASTVVKAELLKTNSTGGAVVVLGSVQVDVNTTGTGNHPSAFAIPLPAVSFNNELLAIRITKVSGGNATTAFNSNDFNSNLVVSPGANPSPSPSVAPSATPTPTPTPTPTASSVPSPSPVTNPDFGPNVYVFSPSTGIANIQNQVNTVFSQMESNQFGSERYAFLFKPGDYSSVLVNLGFYTSVIGLGTSPDAVTLNGVQVDAGWFGGNATQNFWRSTENVSTTGGNRWAVAQAAPFRRMHIRGDLGLAPTGFGWASGGYIADSKVDGAGVFPYSQQQWYTRDSQVAGWNNAVWNMVFSGVAGAPANSFPNPAYTTLATTPISREKPFLYVDGAGAYYVRVPDLRTNSSGITWASGSTPGTSISINQFYIAKPGDTAATINAKLASGYNLLLTPGIYHVSQPINVTRANTVVLGIGYPTIVPDNGSIGMTISDVDGVKLAGILFDAGTVNSSVLLQVGPAGSSASHSANPTTVQDIFFRIGGAGAGKATTSLLVNSNNVIIDHIWAWRADHGTGIGWTSNTADTGLVVNGANVLALGLFVEHYQKYNVIWNGQGGRTIFFQNELPYDVPNQASWMNGSTNGYAAYKVASSVTSHEAWGMGSYCYFNVNPVVVAARGFEAPVNANVKFHDILTVSLGGMGSITNVINTTGATAQGADTIPVNIVSYP